MYVFCIHEPAKHYVNFTPTIGKSSLLDGIAFFGQIAVQLLDMLATGDAVIAECSPDDRIWGIGIALDDPRHQDVFQWQGESILGRALMRVRDTLRNEEA